MRIRTFSPSNLTFIYCPADFEASREEEAKLQPSRDSAQEHGHQTGQEMRVRVTRLDSCHSVFVCHGSGALRSPNRPLRLSFYSLLCFPPSPSPAAAFWFDLSVCSWRRTRLFIPTSGWRISVSHKLRPLVYKCREELDVWDCKSTLHEVWDDSPRLLVQTTVNTWDVFTRIALFLCT